MADFEVKLSKKSVKYLREMPDLARKAAFSGLQVAMYGVEARAVNHYGDRGLKVGKGAPHLKNTIKGKAYKEGKDTLIGILSANTPYASVHELGTVGKGGTMPDIIIKNYWGHKGVKQIVKIPPRPYLRPALEFKMNFIKNTISKSMVKIIEAG